MAELEQFCILAKTQKSRACAALIQQVLNHKKIFVFGELLALPSVVSLKNTEFEKSFSSLELFAYGTYKDYLENRDLYLELTDAQLTKLKQLTIISLAAKEKVISYSTLQNELDLPRDNIRALEDLVIDIMYAGHMTGKIDHRNQRVRVRSVMSRDVKLEQIDELVDKLKNWKLRCDTLKGVIGQSSEYMKGSKAVEQEDMAQLQALALAKKASLRDAIDGGVDPKDLDDSPANNMAAGPSAGGGGVMTRRGGAGQNKSSSSGGNDGKSFGKRLMSGLTGYGADRGGQSKGPVAAVVETIAWFD